MSDSATPNQPNTSVSVTGNDPTGLGRSNSSEGHPVSPFEPMDPHRLRDMVVDKQGNVSHSLQSNWSSPSQQNFMSSLASHRTSTGSNVQSPLNQLAQRQSGGQSPLGSPLQQPMSHGTAPQSPFVALPRVPPAASTLTAAQSPSPFPTPQQYQQQQLLIYNNSKVEVYNIQNVYLIQSNQNQSATHTTTQITTSTQIPTTVAVTDVFGFIIITVLVAVSFFVVACVKAIEVEAEGESEEEIAEKVSGIKERVAETVTSIAASTLAGGSQIALSSSNISGRKSETQTGLGSSQSAACLEKAMRVPEPATSLKKKPERVYYFAESKATARHPNSEKPRWMAARAAIKREKASKNNTGIGAQNLELPDSHQKMLGPKSLSKKFKTLRLVSVL